MDLAEASKFMLQNDYLYKTTLSRRLLHLHQPGDIVLRTNNGVFFINVHKHLHEEDKVLINKRFSSWRG